MSETLSNKLTISPRHLSGMDSYLAVWQSTGPCAAAEAGATLPAAFHLHPETLDRREGAEAILETSFGTCRVSLGRLHGLKF